MKKLWSNYKKVTPDRWRQIGDSILLAQAGLTGIIMTLPVSDNAKVWAIAIVNFLGIIGKIMTNFSAKKDNEPSSDK